jgi:hypothetical protein
MCWAFGSGANGWDCVAVSLGTVGSVACAIVASWYVPVWDVVVRNGGAMTPVEAVVY